MKKESKLQALGNTLRDISSLTGYPSRCFLLISFQPNTDLSQLSSLGANIIKNKKQTIILKDMINKIHSGNQLQNIYCLHLAWIFDRDKFQKKNISYIKDLQYLHFFLEILEESQMTVYLCMQRNKRNFEQLRRLYNILGSENYGKIILEDKSTNFSDMRSISIRNISEIPKDKSFSDFCFKTDSLNGLFSLNHIQDKRQINPSLQKIKSTIQNHLISFLNIAKNLIEAILSSQQIPLTQKLTYIKIQFIFGNVHHELAQNQDFILKNKSSLERMREIYFAYRFFEVYRIYKNTPDNLKNGKKFIKEVFKQMKVLSEKLEWKIENMIEEVNLASSYIEGIEQLFKCTISSYFNRNIIGYCKEWIPSRQKFLKFLSKMEILPNLSVSYYSNLSTVFSLPFQVSDFLTNQRYIQIGTRMNSKKLILRINKNKTIMLSFYQSNPHQLAQAIKDSIQICQQLKHIQQLKKQNLEVIIWKDVAQCLTNINKPKLALEIYQKIKFYTKMEACVTEILLQISKEEQIELLAKISEYFSEVSEYQLSKKYAQRVYQMDPSQVSLIVNNKKEYLFGERSDRPEIRMMKQFQPKNPESFTNMKLSHNFWSQIQNLENTIRTSEKYGAKIKKLTFQKIIKSIKK